ncbi:hypothetical protein [Salinispora arenicola]|uniref:hypothetical protein n=1 Tax=Salinispora arenicola TaxID=168697 RepID=UPI0003A3F4C2|nr:hypothetical protein [Salinispora arenicola]
MFGIAERRGAVTVALSRAQGALLQVVYDEFRAGVSWPTMYQVDRAFIRLKLRGGASAVAILRGLPDGLLMRNQSRPDPIPQDEIKLTISGVARCDGGGDDVEAFLRAVRWCAKQEVRREPETGQASVRVSRKEIARAVPARLRADATRMDRLYLLLTLHHWGTVGSGRSPDGADWELSLGPEVRRFKNVRSAEEFIDARVGWCEEEERRLQTHPAAGVEQRIDDVPGPRVYVSPHVVDQLRTAPKGRWDTTKLIALAKELDACVQAGHVYASHAVLRALLDHVPPLFGQKTFSAVASSHSWGRTDSRYVGRLSTFRDQGDDALHRQISKSPDLLILDDLPQAVAVNSLLRGCAEQLRKP